MRRMNFEIQIQNSRGKKSCLRGQMQTASFGRRASQAASLLGQSMETCVSCSLGSCQLAPHRWRRASPVVGRWVTHAGDQTVLTDTIKIVHQFITVSDLNTINSKNYREVYIYSSQ